MQQLELFEETGLQPIKRWLYVWTDAERNKNAPSATALETQGRNLPKQVGGSEVTRQKPAQAKSQPNRQAVVPAAL
jgi:hypothetical protein